MERTRLFLLAALVAIVGFWVFVDLSDRAAEAACVDHCWGSSATRATPESRAVGRSSIRCVCEISATRVWQVAP